MGLSLGNGALYWNDVALALHSALYLFFAGTLQEQLYRFLQHCASFFNRITLAGNVKFGTQRHVSVGFPLN